MENNTAKVVMFGELMLSLNTKDYERFVQAGEFKARFTGAEANAAVSCANYGMEVYVVSKLPKHEIGDACINYLRRYGLDTRYIARGGDRIGVIYVEAGYSQRPSKVLYDRNNSSIREVKGSDFDWRRIFEGKNWFHFSGTAPALGTEVVAVLLEALKTAKEMKITVSLDYNFRSKLWSKDKARKVMQDLIRYVDVGIGNEEDCDTMFEIKAEKSDVYAGKINVEGYESVAKQMVERYGLKYQAITLRESFSASKNGWSAILHDGKTCYRGKRYEIDVLDRVGAGDSFTGSLIYGMTKGSPLQEALDFSIAASCLKHSIPGDFGLVSKEEVEKLMQGDASGRVQR